MFKRIHWKSYVPFGGIAAMAYCIPVIFFLRDANYTESWLLFVGNFLFLFPVMLSLFQFNKQRKQNASSVSMLAAGHITTITGILISCVLCFVLLLLFVPGLFQPGIPEKVLTHSPANTIHGKTNGLGFMIFADGIFGNMSTGSFITIIYSFSLKGDQTKEKVSPQQADL
jgi:hypothetical protein